MNFVHNFVGLELKYSQLRLLRATDRYLMLGFDEITSMAERINLPQIVIDRAKFLLKSLNDRKTLKGRSYYAKATACLYIACRQENTPRTYKEMCAISNSSKKEIGRCFKLILRVLSTTSIRSVDSGDFIFRFCSNLSKYLNLAWRNLNIWRIASRYEKFLARQIYQNQWTKSRWKYQKQFRNWIKLTVDRRFQLLPLPSISHAKWLTINSVSIKYARYVAFRTPRWTQCVEYYEITKYSRKFLIDEIYNRFYCYKMSTLITRKRSKLEAAVNLNQFGLRLCSREIAMTFHE